MVYLKRSIVSGIMALIAPLALASSLPERYILAGTLAGKSVQLELTLEIPGGVALVSTGRASARFIGEDQNLTGRIQDGEIRLRGAGLQLTSTLPEQYEDGPLAFSGNLGNGKRFSLPVVASYLERHTVQGPFIDVKSETPVFLRAPWRQVNGALERFVQTPASAFLREARSVGLTDEGNYYNTYENRLEVMTLTPTLLSVLESQFTYTGGAHPNTAYRSQTFHATGGSVEHLTLQDLFGGDVPGTLLGEVTERLKRQKASMIVDGSVKLKLRDLSVFNLSEQGLVFTFAPYAVASYAEGAFTVTVPYEKLNGQLEPDFLPGG